jgi:hypothetical protein
MNYDCRPSRHGSFFCVSKCGTNGYMAPIMYSLLLIILIIKLHSSFKNVLDRSHHSIYQKLLLLL